MCSDGLIVGDETCEDDDTDDGDGCSASCQTESGWNCDGVTPVSVCFSCGDGVIQPPETCDDGSGECCTVDCLTYETGFYEDLSGLSACVPQPDDGIITHF